MHICLIANLWKLSLPAHGDPIQQGAPPSLLEMGSWHGENRRHGCTCASNSGDKREEGQFLPLWLHALINSKGEEGGEGCRQRLSEQGQPCLFRVTECLVLPLPCCRNSFLVQSAAAAFRALNEIIVMPVGERGVPGQRSACWGCSAAGDWLYINRDKTWRREWQLKLWIWMPS